MIPSMLKDTLITAIRNRMPVMLVGAPGIGKSVLSAELNEQLAESGGYLAHGKFDLYRRDLPYAAFVGAFESFAKRGMDRRGCGARSVVPR